MTVRTTHRRGAPLRRWTWVNGHQLHSVEGPAPSARGRPTVVLLHGAVVSHRYFLPLLEALTSCDPALPVAAVELPGTGASSRGGEPRDIEGQADLVAAWLRVTNRVPAVVVGSSMGAQTAVEVAVRAPALVESLVLIGSTVDRASRNLLSQLGKLLVDATVESPRQLAITLGDGLRSNPRAMARYLRASLEHHVEDRLPYVTAPVVLIRGEHDPLVPRRWLGELHRATRNARIVEIPAAAHCAHERRPDEVAAIIDRMRSQN